MGTLKIPAIGLSVKIYQGTDNTSLKKGAESGVLAHVLVFHGPAARGMHHLNGRGLAVLRVASSVGAVSWPRAAMRMRNSKPVIRKDW